MTQAIVYSSKTGNTKTVAEAIAEVLDADQLCYIGAPDAAALSAERIYLGFWTDKGTCDANTAAFLATLENKEIFLFGTAGFGGDPAFFEAILERVRRLIPDSNRLIGSYMCQGKMPAAVRARYEKMSADPEKHDHMQMMIENFDRAQSHPDQNDLQAAQQTVLAAK